MRRESHVKAFGKNSRGYSTLKIPATPLFLHTQGTSCPIPALDGFLDAGMLGQEQLDFPSFT
jgi:hypothetical protein